MKKTVSLKASVLASVLVVCTLMVLSILAVFAFLDMSNAGFYQWHYQEQQRANLESAFTLYCQDSSWNSHNLAGDTVCLFPDDKTSGVYLSKELWGGYEFVKVESYDRKHRIVRLVGRCEASGYREAALYVPDRGRALGIAGDARIRGNVYSSSYGVFYPQIRSVFFEGTQLENTQLCKSSYALPPVLLPGNAMAAYLPGPVDADLHYCRVKPGEEIRVVSCPGELSGADVSGRVVLYSECPLHIDSSCRLENVMVMAPVVSLGDGLRGRMQVWAADTVIVGERAWLEEPSGIYVYGNKPARLARLGQYSRVDGYVVVGSGDIQEKTPNLRIPATALCRGLVYADGVAHIEGHVKGSVFVREPCLFTPEGYYAMVLYGTKLELENGIAYPLMLDGPYERRSAVWLE